MRKFEFRLEKVLDYRRLLEDQAKNLYLEAKINRLEAERVFDQIDQKRASMMAGNLSTVEARIALEHMHARLDDEVLQQRTIVDLLQQEEEAKRIDWVEKQRELKALENLREDALTDWKYELEKHEQAELDEWASQRRAI